MIGLGVWLPMLSSGSSKWQLRQIYGSVGWMRGYNQTTTLPWVIVMPLPVHPLTELLSFLDVSGEPYVVFDRQYRVLAANALYRERTGVDRVVGRYCYEISHHYPVPCDQAGESCPLSRSLSSGQMERVLHLHHTPNGEEYVDIELTPVRDAGGEIAYFVEKMVAMNHAKGLTAAHGLIGRSPAFQKMLEMVSRVAKSEAVVLLEGESGTGKELVANALHQSSRRAKGPFTTVDCSGIPETLFESELFGHERGAFTGATSRKQGLVEAASGGTLFLDELGEIPLTMQVKLLRLLETGTYRRVGSTEIRRADIRVISATHRSLREMVARGEFRADLYYRINVFPIVVPALRERATDIPLLVESLLGRVAPDRPLGVSAEAMQRLVNARYPGNVRELRNWLERASLLCDGDEIGVAHLPMDFDSGCVEESPGGPREAFVQCNDRVLIEAVGAHHGSRKSLAEKLGMSERTLYRRIAALRCQGACGIPDRESSPD